MSIPHESPAAFQFGNPVVVKTGDRFTVTGLRAPASRDVDGLLERLEHQLGTAGLTLASLVSIHAFARHASDLARLDEAFERRSIDPAARPAVSWIEVTRLLDDAAVELTAVASAAPIERFVEPAARFPAITTSGGFAWLSGIRPDDREAAIETQVAACFEQLDRSLALAGIDRSQVFSSLVYVRNMADRKSVNDVTRRYFPAAHFPLRVIAEPVRFLGDALFEMVFEATDRPFSFVTTAQGQQPTGTFSQGAVVADFVFCSGVRPIDPRTARLVEGDFETRVLQCLKNLTAVLTAAGAGFSDVYTVTAYVRDLRRQREVERVITANWPGRAAAATLIFEINRLNEDHDVEISCSAYRGCRSQERIVREN